MRPRLHRAAYALCGDWHLADDLTQEAIITVFRQWSRLDPGDQAHGYGFRVLVNAVKREHRRSWRRWEAGLPVPDTPHQPAASVETRQLVFAALARLGPRQRLIVVLRYWEDLSVEQTAHIAGCSPGSVRSQSSRAISTLRNHLGPILFPERCDPR